jgi:hypothetical protein
MRAAAILSRLRAAGVIVRAVAGELKLKGPGPALSEPVLKELREIKPELLALLSQEAVPAPAPAAPLDLDGIAGRIEGWLNDVDKVPKACGPQGQRLKVLTADFLLGCWAYEALRFGWGGADLFAIDGGLIPEMSRRPLHFRSIGEDMIFLINGRGAYEEWPRRDMTDAVPWWQDDRCVGDGYAMH